MTEGRDFRKVRNDTSISFPACETEDFRAEWEERVRPATWVTNELTDYNERLLSALESERAEKAQLLENFKTLEARYNEALEIDFQKIEKIEELKSKLEEKDKELDTIKLERRTRYENCQECSFREGRD